ncbi:Lrp/AsnC family transcriptional regulator [Rhodobacteraceae bacterium B1Z28]|uniref:Lrp/AsnC family transcriptional regulator n=1 Tax=Ruegeria haliotis TaxID=2747601 RepID=A0ABX2PUX3_9RHOB|nr:Lrp/AsnC family transcriptional regulator [Ruegeria haliotis]NVO56927.1 Lrp/AsnC family transcriptional regulator [Ruegeria haliotis]
MTTSLDQTDRAILTVLQHDTRLSTDTLADRVGASRSSIQRRLKRLNETGVIEREVIQLNPQKANALMTFVVEVELERERVDLLDDFKRSMLALDEVQQCYYITGHADFILIVLVKDMNDYDRFSRLVFVENPNIRRFATSVVVDRVKASLRVPLE